MTTNPQSPYVVQVDPLIAPLVPGYLENRGKDALRIAELLAYHVAVLRGTDVDQPRNLAKSVTVE